VLCRTWEEEAVTSAAVAAGLHLTPLGAYRTTGLMRPGVLLVLAPSLLKNCRKLSAAERWLFGPGAVQVCSPQLR
jgi:hypothetical protein